ncbi:PD-(D/E)XK motif protein [Marinimicrobium sp. C6131]|uniref:PD-(D/E)XK motif protein n=1 Tax=Marinimicrobium sp. C6131 TaxID=3022676 RepID=UPI00223E6ADC|nr:PD-(D/E)XK motif protein [Marinimicrobium sp. C6131]UZJ44240.1 PD-(D/E)XK motif protein [Marinimicrobium sp. C6131]
MTTRATPWEQIAEPRSDYNVRRISDTTGIPLYWGKDAVGQRLFIIELEGDHAYQYRRDVTRLNGIRVDLRNGENDKQQRLVLTLSRNVDSDLFLGLCETLKSSLASVVDSAVALSVTLQHLKRWKAFLAGKKARLLTTEEIRGLFAELYVLRQLYLCRLTQDEAVDAWCGADDSHQDFIFGNVAIEVKSLSGRERNSVRISSEDQLEALVDRLFLMTVRLIDMPDAETARSLNDIVALIEKELVTAEAIEQFSEKIAGCGYAALTDYDRPRFAVGGTNGYAVTDEFPKIVRSRISKGLVHVAYDIQLEVISPFACKDDEIFGRS